MNDLQRRLPRRVLTQAGLSMVGLGLVAGRPSLGNALWQESGGLKTLTESPYNAEALLDRLAGQYLTPLDAFYIRSNGPVPKVSLETHSIAVEGLVDRPTSIKAADLKKQFGEVERNAALMCAGNRRTEMGAVKKVSGTPWSAGAIGNAKWTGVDLAKVLRSVGVQRGAKYIWFESIDRCKMKSGGETAFGASIPIEKALDGTTMLAFAMNGAPLSGEHGFPLRAIVPGYIGARSVKWLGKIVVSDKPSPNHFVADNYKIVSETTKEALAAAEPIGEYTINSIICTQEVFGSDVELKGFALPRGGRLDRIAKVEILKSDHSVLCEAELLGPGEAFCWEPWRAKVELPKGEHSLAVRATGTRGDIQPLEPNWNALGYLFNAPHKVVVHVK